MTTEQPASPQLSFPEFLTGDPAARPSPKAEPETGLARKFERVFRRLGLRRPIPEFRVEFQPFAGLRSHIRLHSNQAEVRITDLLADAPPLVMEALAEILIAQLFRRRPSREARECYLAYVFRPAVRQRIDDARRRRGHKRLLPPRGRYFDLEEIFSRINRRFFEGKLAPVRIGWSARASRSLLGHYDAAHGTIAVSGWLDRPSVPRYIVEYLVFHEALHIVHPVTRRGHRRVMHPPEFLVAEKKFPRYVAARRWLKRLAASPGH